MFMWCCRCWTTAHRRQRPHRRFPHTLIVILEHRCDRRVALGKTEDVEKVRGQVMACAREFPPEFLNGGTRSPVPRLKREQRRDRRYPSSVRAELLDERKLC